MSESQHIVRVKWEKQHTTTTRTVCTNVLFTLCYKSNVSKILEYFALFFNDEYFTKEGGGVHTEP